MPKILLVEDNDDNWDMLSRRLERRGYGVERAVDGVEAVAKAGAGFDLILMDVNLPLMDGLEATRRIRADRQGTAPADHRPVGPRSDHRRGQGDCRRRGRLSHQAGRTAAPAGADRTPPEDRRAIVIVEEAPIDIPARLHLASAADRRDILDTLMAAHPDGRLILVGDVDTRHNLRGVPFSGGRLRGASLAFSDLHASDFSGANLSQADMRHAALEGANLEGADLTEVDLTEANLGEANLGEALLEDARMEQASLRFANLAGAVLESANLKDADFWGANLAKADLNQASARAAHFGEVRAEAADFRKSDLRDADFANADLRGALFSGADLRGASLRGANLAGAHLSGALLQGVDLSQCDLTGAFWDGALLDHTRLGQAQIGQVGEEVTVEPRGAARAYLALERNFEALGDSAAGSWAYLKRRRMQKRAALAEARVAAVGTPARRRACRLGDLPRRYDGRVELRLRREPAAHVLDDHRRLPRVHRTLWRNGRRRPREPFTARSSPTRHAQGR